jgi:hypothetical protein
MEPPVKDKHIYKYLIRCCWKKGVGVEVVDVVGALAQFYHCNSQC